MKQTTIAGEVEVQGRGLHKGKMTSIIFRPAKTDSSIVITDKGCKYRLSEKLVTGTKRGTSIKYKNSRIWTIEHMVSAVRGMGIDNIEIEFTAGDEPPIMDGSAGKYADALKKAGIKRQKKEAEVFGLKTPVVIKDGESYMAVLPYKGFKVHYFSDFLAHGFGPDEHVFEAGKDNYEKSISRARTFGFKKELEWLMKAGLIKGADMNSAILLDNGKPVNTKFRYKNEMTRHKVLDIIGDFGLLGARLDMMVIAVKTGHRHNIQAVKTVAKLKG